MCGSVSMLQVGGQSTIVSSHITYLNSATLIEKEGVDLLQQWSDFDPCSLVGTSIFLPG